MADTTIVTVPTVRVLAVDCGVRPMHLRLPFKFGAATLTRCPQLFVRAVVDCGLQGTTTGWAAEMMVPRWFDKRSGPSHAGNVRDLQLAVAAAADAYTHSAAQPAFGLFERHYAELMAEGAFRDSTELSTAFGQAVLDRAVLDALCRATRSSVYGAIQRNLVGLTDTAIAADMADWDWNHWLGTLVPSTTLHARHTIGMLDALDDDGLADDPAALPVGLPAIVRRYGHRHFKIKLGGDVATDLARLDAVLATLDAVQPGHCFTLDGNEQYPGTDALAALYAGLRAMPRLAARPDALLYIEQPLARDASLEADLASLDSPAPLLLDEADGTLDAFPAGRKAGWRGVSSKGCKGLYKAIINRARCDKWNARAPEGHPYFMSAEDLTCQAGVAVQQDLALAALLGLSHCERNGHHYVDGFGDAPEQEQIAFAVAHMGLYEASSGRARLAIQDGRIAIGSLARTGFASSAIPDFDSLRPLADAPLLV
ncbi:enolase C-terminal domain-like protein [Variovorax sp. dw_308]|uniref:enolase C-terminal domain-like protein n=1 Tax=Variovorax sp. dw_308 TaxID=2721546 RepID=UPI001C4881B2|nr:enolase C-terminal domain-like protein [Variovorax sp. dw_308]